MKMKCPKSVADLAERLCCDISDCETEGETCKKILSAMGIELSDDEWASFAMFEEMSDGKGDDDE